MPPRITVAATQPGPSRRRPPPPPLGRSTGGGAGSCPIAPTPGDLFTSSPYALASSHALRLGNTPSRFLPSASPMRSPAPLMCVGCSAMFPTLQALCAHLNSRGTTCGFAPDTCPVMDADRHFLAPCTFYGRYFRSGGLSKHKTNFFTATLRPPNRRHAVLRFRAVGRLRCLSNPRPPPSNGNLSMGPLMGRTPKPSSSPTSFPSDILRPRTASPLQWYDS
jgi:hypothetical protein